MANSERLAEEMSQAFSTIDRHLRSPRLVSWGADCEWLLSGLQNTSRTALDLLVYTGRCSQAESDSTGTTDTIGTTETTTKRKGGECLCFETARTLRFVR